jgi:hypothetical protein
MWFKYLLVGFICVSTLVRICLIGEDRKVLTKQDVAWNAVINGLLVWGIIHYF